MQRELPVLNSKAEGKVYAVLAWQPGTIYSSMPLSAA
jgi:hypothetical protein